MTAVAWDPCLTPVRRRRLPGDARIRVVEILATGTNGGAQEHLFNLLSRLDQMEQRHHMQLQETANQVYAHLGQLEERIEHHPMPAGMPPPERTQPQGNGRPR